MRFELNEFHRNVPDTELIEDLQRVSNQLKQDTVTIDDYNEFGKFSCDNTYSGDLLVV